MVVRKQEMKTKEQEKMRGGSGIAHFRHLIPDDMFYGHGRLYSLVTLQPGGSIGWHEHHDESESFFILSGTATISDNGSEEILQAGDCCICPDGEGHSIENRTDAPLQFIALILHGAGIQK